jgi:hypothetical protein
MIWDKLFAKGEIFTQGDRQQLEALEAKTTKLRAWVDRIKEEWPDSGWRLDLLRTLAGKLAESPDDEGIFQRMTVAATMPSDPRFGFQHREIACGTLQEKIDQMLEPSIEIVRRVIKRALDRAEAELKKVEAAEKKQSEAEGFPFSPSGKILALQERVLSLRNGLAAKYPHEGAIQGPGPWQERLKEWL